MSNGLNRVTLVGNLGADPDLKFTQAGQAVLRLRLATSESWQDAQGKKQERVEWHTVVIWGKRGEALSKILSKGRTLWIEGKIRTRSWEDREGGKRYATEVHATDVGLVGSGDRTRGSRHEGGNGGNGGGFGGDPYGGPGDEGGYTGADDDIPL